MTVSTVDGDHLPKPRTWVRVLIGLIVAGLAVMWIYAFFFASRQNVNALGDKAWTTRAETICAAADAELRGLPDIPNLTDTSRDALDKRAEVLEQSNVILDEMITELDSSRPDDVDGAEIVTLWLDDYRTYLADRIAYADGLRNGTMTVFNESTIDAMPITGFIDDVARQNRMASCQAPPLS